MPPTARRERAGKSRLDRADGKRQNENNENLHLSAVASQSSYSNIYLRNKD